MNRHPVSNGSLLLLADKVGPLVTIDHFPASTQKQIKMEVAPTGWDSAIKMLKLNPHVDNPYALAYWLNDRGVTPGKSAESDPPVSHDSPPKGYPDNKSKYADPENYKYPVDTADRTRSAMSYFSQPKNQTGYSPEEVKKIWGRIVRAAKKFGIEVSDDVANRAESESMSPTGSVQLTRPSRPQESGFQARNNIRFREARVQKDADGKDKLLVTVVIMSEGLGNQRDMHFYSKDAILTAVAPFEGAQCYSDHPSKTEEIDRPERSVKDLVGYFCDVKPSEDSKDLEGNLKLEDTEVGHYWFDKIKEAIAYQARYPDKTYFAISINADGKTHEEERAGQKIHVVDSITEVFSADLVTKPALQTRFVKIVESVAAVADRKRSARFARVMQAAITESERNTKSTERRNEPMKNYQQEVLKHAAKCADADTPADVNKVGEALATFHKKASEDEAFPPKALTALKSACDKAAEDDADSDGVMDHLMKALKHLGGMNDDEDEAEAKKKAAEAEAKKKSAEDEEEAKKKAAEAEAMKKAEEAKKKGSEDEPDPAMMTAKKKETAALEDRTLLAVKLLEAALFPVNSSTINHVREGRDEADMKSRIEGLKKLIESVRPNEDGKGFHVEGITERRMQESNGAFNGDITDRILAGINRD